MQLSAFPSATSELEFDDVVPKATSTRRVAAAAFYHCLGMSRSYFREVKRCLFPASSVVDKKLAERTPGRTIRRPEDQDEVSAGVNRSLCFSSHRCLLSLSDSLLLHI